MKYEGNRTNNGRPSEVTTDGRLNDGYLIGVGIGVSRTAFSVQFNHQYTRIWGK